MSDDFELRFFNLLETNMNDIKKTLNRLVESQQKQDMNMQKMQGDIKKLYELHNSCEINSLDKKVKSLEKETVVGRYLYKIGEVIIKNPKQSVIVALLIFGLFLAKDGMEFFDWLKKIAGL